MGVLVLLNEFVEIGGVDLSDHVKSATLAMEATVLDASAMGDGWVKNKAGLKSGTLNIEFLDDFDVAQVDAILWPLFGTNSTFKVRPDAGAVSTTNPQYSGEVVISQHSVGGTLNELAKKNPSWPTSGPPARTTA